MKKLLTAALLAVFFVGAPVAYAAGLYGQFPAASSVTGNETMPADTNLGGGQQPQTYTITTTLLKNWMFGNTASGTATATGTTTATATLNTGRGTVTSAALTTAAGGTYVLTLTDSTIAATSVVLASVGNVSNSAGSPAITTITAAAGSVVITVQNVHASAALNGTIEVNFLVVN